MFPYHFLSKIRVKLNIIQYGENTKIPFLKFLKKNKPMICFSYAFDQSDSNLFVKKIWGTAS